MNKLDLTALIERVRNATGPDRYADCHFWVLAQGGDARMRVCDSSMQDFIWERGVDGFWLRSVVKFRAVPKYTASIDAALALVERMLPGWQYHMGTCGEDDMPWACITEPIEPCRDFAASAPEITIALLTALLLALTSNQEGNDEA